MIKIELSEEEINQVAYERYHHPHPRVQKRMEAVFLKSQGLPHNQICKLVGCTNNTLLSYFRMYAQGGIKKLKELRFYRPQSELINYQNSIEDYFREHPPASVNEAIDKIEELTGLRRHPTQVRKFMKKIGMRFRKVGTIPAKADPDEQEAFKKKR